jgi:hypothetical protein
MYKTAFKKKRKKKSIYGNRKNKSVFGKTAKSVFGNKKPAMIRRPKSITCYICGRQYGTRSLGIHIKTCKKKWYIQEGLKLKKKDMRPCPRTPRGLHQLLAKKKITHADINAYNSGAFKTFNQEALVKCQFCNRTFLEERMKGHR